MRINQNFLEKKNEDDIVKKKIRKWLQTKKIAIKIMGTKFERLKNYESEIENICNLIDYLKIKNCRSEIEKYFWFYR